MRRRTRMRKDMIGRHELARETGAWLRIRLPKSLDVGLQYLP